LFLLILSLKRVLKNGFFQSFARASRFLKNENLFEAYSFFFKKTVTTQGNHKGLPLMALTYIDHCWVSERSTQHSPAIVGLRYANLIDILKPNSLK
jgi:hypothetical protein